MTHREQIAVLVGPTASGKSALALRIAQARPTVIINADAIQMVRTLRVITARPTEHEEAQAEHALYGVLDATTPTSVALWLELVKPLIERAWEQKKLPLLVGGTGMYLSALMHGISKIPPIPEEVRQKVRGWGLGAGDWLKETPSPGVLSSLQPPASSSLHTLLAARDPLMAARLKPGDTQRILRALEVIEATGQSIAVWQNLGKERIFPQAEFSIFSLMPERAALYANIDQRFDNMLKNGAIEEVRQLRARGLAAQTPILRAVGVPELSAYLDGVWNLDQAITKAQQHSRNYAKRQMTWIRNQLPEAIAISEDTALEIFMK